MKIEHENIKMPTFSSFLYSTFYGKLWLQLWIQLWLHFLFKIKFDIDTFHRDQWDNKDKKLCFAERPS